MAVIGFAIQQTSVVPAVQTIQKDLGGSSEWSAWLVTVYLIVATVATPAMGRLADLHGRRRMLLVGLGVFIAGSIAAAFSVNMLMLIVCRGAQGIGGAVYPLSLAIAREALPQEKVRSSVAVLTGAFGVGTAIGFVGGGVLADLGLWRWIFGAGAIVVALGAVLAWRSLPTADGNAEGDYDLVGTAVLAAAAIALLGALTLVVPFGWGSPATIALFVVAVVAAASWIILEARREDPLVDVHVLRDRSVAVANLATMGLGWGLFSSYLLLPQVIETDPSHSGFGLGGGPAVVGLLLLPLAVGQTAAGVSGAVLSERFGPRRVFAFGLACVAIALATLGVVHLGSVSLAFLALLLGIGAGLGLETSSDVATQGVAADVAAVSSSVNSTIRRLAGGIGGQVSTILLASLVIDSGPSHDAYLAAFSLAAALSVVGVALVLARNRRQTEAVSRRDTA